LRPEVSDIRTCFTTKDNPPDLSFDRRQPVWVVVMINTSFQLEK
jgi:hypothetical protein